MPEKKNGLVSILPNFAKLKETSLVEKKYAFSSITVDSYDPQIRKCNKLLSSSFC